MVLLRDANVNSTTCTSGLPVTRVVPRASVGDYYSVGSIIWTSGKFNTCMYTLYVCIYWRVSNIYTRHC